MKKIYLILSGVLAGLSSMAQISLDVVSTYHTGIFDEGAAEIVTYDEDSQKLFFSNSDDNSVGILDFSDPTDLTLESTIDIDAYGDGVNSVSAYDGYIAVAVEIDESPGKIVFFDTDGDFVAEVTVGHLPDMVTFSHDGEYVVAACEGEPSDDWTFDPAGTVAIIDVSGGVENVAQSDVTLTEIGSYGGSFDGVRIFPEAIDMLFEDFQDTALALNEFDVFNELSTGTWYYDDFSDDYFAEANGFGDDTNSIDWMISPLVNLGSFEEAYVSFENTRNFSGGSLDFLISDDYDGNGDPTSATWDTLTSQAAWSTGGYADTNSGAIDISAYLGSEVAVAFLYQTTGTGGGDGALWQIDDIHIWGKHSLAANLEPEYVAISDDNSTAFVGLQENNAVAVVNLANGNITDVLPLGYKDHNVAGNELDPSDKDDGVNIASWPFRGLYQPDAIASISIDGTEYILTANEGDARDYDAYSEEARLEDVELDATAFPNAADLQLEENGGRINITLADGDTDGDGDYDEIYTYGARSFTIWSTSGNVVFDSGDEFEQKTAEAYPDDFNSGNDENGDFEGRSDNKGPEPEAIEVAHIGESYYAFIGLERIGGVMMYDITDPANSTFVDYVNNRDFSVEDVTTEDVGDLGCEDVYYISDAASPDGKFYIVTSNEVSGTVTVFEISGLIGLDETKSNAAWSVFPNPTNAVLNTTTVDSYRITDVSGRMVVEVKNQKTIDVADLQPGVYFVSNSAGETTSFVKN